MLKLYIGYAKTYEMAKKAPARLIFYRGMSWSFFLWRYILTSTYQDGVSEGQFRHVLNNGM